MKKLSIRITSIILVIICCVSTITVSVASTSAATTPKTVVTQTLKEYNDKLSDLIKSIPYAGTTLQVIYDLYSNDLFDILFGEEKTEDFDKIQEQLDDIQKTLNAVDIKTQRAENSNFENCVNELIILCDEAMTIQKEITNYQEKINEIKQKKVKTAADNTNLNTYKENLEKKQKELTSKVIDTSTNKMSDKFSGYVTRIERYIQDKAYGQDKNPFLNYFDAEKKALKFTSDALKATREYQEEAMTVYITAVSLYMGEMYRQYSQAIKKSTQEEISSLAKLVGKKCENTLDAYQTIVEKEDNTPNVYYDSNNSYVNIGSVGSAEIKSKIFYPLQGDTQQMMLTYLSERNPNEKRNADIEAKYKEFDRYIDKINEMISNNYNSDEDFKKYTLRQFLESKGISIPKEAKYLVAGKIKNVGFSNSPVLPTYELDKSSNTIVNQELSTRVFIAIHYLACSNLCYFIEKKDGSSEAVAEVTNNGNTTQYDSFENAMNSAAKIAELNKKPTVVKLLKDWEATVYADGTTSFGTGLGFKDGAIHLTFYVSLDLNGHKVDRKLERAMNGGSVIVQEGSAMTTDGTTYGMVYSSSSTPGLITGGYTTGDGGGVYGKPDLLNCVVSGNHAQGNGGGVAVFSAERCTVGLKNVEISGNITDSMGGGVSTKVERFQTSDVFLYGKVVIKDNYKKSGSSLINNDCYLEDGFFTKATIWTDKSNPLTSDSKIGIISNTNDNWLKITEKRGGTNINNFFYDAPNKYTIKSEGSGDSQYLYIKKQK